MPQVMGWMTNLPGKLWRFLRYLRQLLIALWEAPIEHWCLREEIVVLRAQYDDVFRRLLANEADTTALATLVGKHTQVHVDWDPRGVSYIITLGRFRDTDSVMVTPVNQATFEEITLMLRREGAYAVTGYLDLPLCAAAIRYREERKNDRQNL